MELQHAIVPVGTAGTLEIIWPRSLSTVLSPGPARISLDSADFTEHWLTPGSCLALGTQTWARQGLLLPAPMVNEGWEMGVDRFWMEFL